MSTSASPTLPGLAAETGAPSALAWIAVQEARCRDDYEQRSKELADAIARQRDPANDGEDLSDAVAAAERNLEFATEAVQRWQKSLREFDKSVAPEKRDTSEKITQAEGEKLLRALAIYERAATESLITQLCQSVLTCSTPEAVYKIVAVQLREAKANAMANAIREGHLPAWCAKAVEEVQ